jgi:hypothetical protein
VVRGHLPRLARTPTETDGGATKPPTPRLAAVEAAEQAPERHEAADTAAGRGGDGGASFGT